MQAHSWYTCRGGEGEEKGRRRGVNSSSWHGLIEGDIPPPTCAALLHNPLASLKLCWTINTHHSQRESALLRPLPFWMKLPRASPSPPLLMPSSPLLPLHLPVLQSVHTCQYSSSGMGPLWLLCLYSTCGEHQLSVFLESVHVAKQPTLSKLLPTRRWVILSLILATRRSWISSCTRSLDPALQT